MNTCLVCFLTNKRLVKVTNRHYNLQQYIHCITASALLYVVFADFYFFGKKVVITTHQIFSKSPYQNGHGWTN